MTGRVIIGEHSYPNDWVEDGKTIRLVICQLCLDTGRQLTDGFTVGPRCDCAVGETLPRPLCNVYCPTHLWSCNQYEDSHHYDDYGNQLHCCSYGRFGHNFYQPKETA